MCNARARHIEQSGLVASPPQRLAAGPLPPGLGALTIVVLKELRVSQNSPTGSTLLQLGKLINSESLCPQNNANLVGSTPSEVLALQTSGGLLTVEGAPERWSA
jgi:hypothetical protein